MKKLLCLTLVALLTLGALPFAALADTAVNRDGETIRLDVYSQLANYSGIQGGWGGILLKDLFNIELNIIPDQDGTYATRMESGSLGDLVVWGANGEDYKNAVNKGMLLDWEESGLAERYAPYIMENYTDALESNRTISGDGKIHGFGHAVALSSENHASFFYTWDIRWDLYKQLGYPEVYDLDDLVDLFSQMKEICPTDEIGNETYAVSIWPDWDGNMVMYVKALATAFYGFDELGFGHYDPMSGQFLNCLDDNSPYMECLRFFNKLYRAGLLDPSSSSNTYDKMSEKLKNGGTFWSIFNYAGSMAYNTDEHMAEGKYMYAMVPEDATPIVYGLGTAGGNRIWSVGAHTRYPELCLEFLNWLATPEGSMTMWYGPKGLMWDYNEEGGTYFTELGALCNNDSAYNLAGVEWTSPYTGKTYALSGTFNDGCVQINNTTLSQDMINPDGNGKETFNKDTWASVSASDLYDIQLDWQQHTGATMADDYMEMREDNFGDKLYVIMPSVPYSESSRSSELDLKWKNCAKAIVENSWRAIYAKSDGEFEYHVRTMKTQCDQFGFKDCLAWCEQEALQLWTLSNKAD